MLIRVHLYLTASFSVRTRSRFINQCSYMVDSCIDFSLFEFIVFTPLHTSLLNLSIFIDAQKKCPAFSETMSLRYWTEAINFNFGETFFFTPHHLNTSSCSLDNQWPTPSRRFHGTTEQSAAQSTTSTWRGCERGMTCSFMLHENGFVTVPVCYGCSACVQQLNTSQCSALWDFMRS